MKVWTDLGESEWSQPAWFETGLLDAAEWVAEWIEPYEPVRADAGERPAYVLRRSSRSTPSRRTRASTPRLTGATRPS